MNYLWFGRCLFCEKALDGCFWDTNLFWNMQPIIIRFICHLRIAHYINNSLKFVRRYFSVRTRILEKPVNWFAKWINWLVSLWCGFLLKGISEQTLIHILLHMYTIWTKTLFNIDSQNSQANNKSNKADFHYIFIF